MNRRDGPRILVMGVVACVLLVLGGCNANRVVGQRYHGPTFGRSQGASSAVVFDSEPIADKLATVGRGYEYGRSDYAYSMRTPTAVTSIDSWPTAPKPSIDYYRWIVLPRATGQYLYFRKDPSYRRRR